MTLNNHTHNFTPEEPAGAAAPKRLLRVGITQGDTNGVGYELILKTFSDSGMFEFCVPVVYGSAKVATYHRKTLGMEMNFHIIHSAAEAVAGRLNLVNCIEEDVKVELGKATREAGLAAYAALESATEALRAGEIDVLVTAPICKSTIQSDDFHFAGHTEYLKDRIGDGAEPLMVLTNSLMRVALVTTHLPVKDIAAHLSQELILEKIKLLYRSLRHDFLLPAPRIAVLGLNPHNGDDGTLGSEEKDIIRPAIEAAVAEGLQCFGPYSSDGFFGAGLYRHFDAVLAMYHDQGLAPFKALSMDDGVNFTAGLPFVRTSPDHGTAFDIAGKGVASPSSFRQALFTAIDIYRNREADDEAHRNPLQKLYHEHREDGDRQRHIQAEKTE